MEDTLLHAYLQYHFFLSCMHGMSWCWQVGVHMAAQTPSTIHALVRAKLLCNALQQLWTYMRSRWIVYYNRVGNRVARGYRKWVRVPVWNSFGWRIARWDNISYKNIYNVMLRVCVVLCRCFYCYCIIVQTAQDRQGTVHARVCYCYRLVLDNTETH